MSYQVKRLVAKTSRAKMLMARVRRTHPSQHTRLCDSPWLKSSSTKRSRVQCGMTRSRRKPRNWDYSVKVCEPILVRRSPLDSLLTCLPKGLPFEKGASISALLASTRIYSLYEGIQNANEQVQDRQGGPWCQIHHEGEHEDPCGAAPHSRGPPR